jgi:uncharacterized protein YjbI with pentapeptide repeats
VPLRCLLRPRFGRLRDFSDSFQTEFYEVRYRKQRPSNNKDALFGGYAAASESVVQFLYEAGLISGTHPIIKLTGATLEEVSLRAPLGTTSSLEYAPINLRGAILNRVVFDFEVKNLAGAHFEGALLKRAEFWPSHLEGAHFEGATLEEANFNGASLEGAHFNGANLTGAHFEEERYSRPEISVDEYGRAITTGDLLRRGANLAKAHLEGTNLKGANFRGANLKEAILRGATGITNEELVEQTTSLEGTTMPNGQKYEDWLKDKEARK